MHSRNRWIVALMACCLVAGASLAFANSHTKAGDAAMKGSGSNDEMLAAMMKLAQPGSQHAMLKKCEGSWKCVSKSWMAPGEPAVTDGSAEFRMILGDRFLEQRYTSTYMGQPFEGYGLYGYDNATKKYGVFWVDNSGTSMMNGAGNYDEAKKLLSWRSSFTGPDGKIMNSRMTVDLTDDKTQVFTMYSIEKGKEAKMMEITYTRQTNASN